MLELEEKFRQEMEAQLERELIEQAAKQAELEQQ